MEIPLLLQFCIALFTGMVAATFIPPVRRSIPRPVEVILWIALLTVCVVGVASITDPQARELSTSAAWGADQVINTAVGLMFSGMGGWLYDRRFPIATWLVILGGADIFALLLLSSRRSAQPWQPRVRLGEWIEVPLPSQLASAGQVASVDPLADINRRLGGAAAVAGATAVAMVVDASTWLRDVLVAGGARRIAHTAAAGRVESRHGLEALHDATAHLMFAARAWYAAAGEPMVSGLASPRARLRAGRIVDIEALLNAHSISGYGRLGALPPTPLEGDDVDANEQQQTDRLAS